MAISNDEFDSAPEEVSMLTSKQSMLQTKKAQMEAVRSYFLKSKELRRSKDIRLKEQAKLKKSKSTIVSEPAQNQVISENMESLKDSKAETLKRQGFVKVPKAKSVGEQEKAAVLKLIAERKAKLGSVSRVAVSQSFRNHMYFRATSK